MPTDEWRKATVRAKFGAKKAWYQKPGKRVKKTGKGRKRDGPRRLMPFGEHKGQPIHKMPTDYLEWLVREQIVRTPELFIAVATELKKRKRGLQSPAPV